MKIKKKYWFCFLAIATFIFVMVFCILNNSEANNSVLISTKKDNNSKVLSLLFEKSVNSGEYELNDSTIFPSNNYRFNETLSKCENGGKLSYNDVTKSVELEASKNDRCYVYFDLIEAYHETCDDFSLACQIAKKADGTNLIFHNGTIDVDNDEIADDAKDGSYRYTGANPDNYVCFGSDELVCPNENLYRIIGVFAGRVKLIKAEYATGEELGVKEEQVIRANDKDVAMFYFSGSANNVSNFFSASSFYTLLNGDMASSYLKKFASSWQEKIDNNIYYIQGINDIKQNAQKIYNNEMGLFSDANVTTINKPVAFMYISDYAYASSPKNWVNTMDNYNNDLNINNNWLYKGVSEWTISRDKNGATSSFYLDTSGNIQSGEVSKITRAIRPTFYLKSEVSYVGGTGSVLDPYRVADTTQTVPTPPDAPKPTLATHILTSINQELNNNLYRYTGKNPANYICFGANNCANDETYLYRIISINDNQIKLIKATSYGLTKYGEGTNKWQDNTVASLLNTTFLNSLEASWQAKILSSSWYVGGIKLDKTLIKENEVYCPGDASLRDCSKSDLEVNQKIGLMDLTDYEESLVDNESYLTTSGSEWLITRDAESLNKAYYLNKGDVNTQTIDGYEYNIRPSFYISADSIYVSGDGTINNPYIIE